METSIMVLLTNPELNFQCEHEVWYFWSINNTILYLKLLTLEHYKITVAPLHIISIVEIYCWCLADGLDTFRSSLHLCRRWCSVSVRVILAISIK